MMPKFDNKKLVSMMEWIRPLGISLIIFFAYFFGNDPISRFHIMGPFIVLLMSGTVALEGLLFGDAAAEKIGYIPNKAYQIQSRLNNAATALTAVLVYVLDWGRYAESTIVTVMLMFFTFSAANHAVSAIKDHNMKIVNLLRPVMSLLLITILVPHMIQALHQ
jgi:hypothetical protein